MKKILYIQYTDPFLWPVIVHGSNILASKGHKILFLGVQSVADPSERIKMTLHKNITIRLLRYLKPGVQQIIQYIFYNFWVFFYCVFWRPQVVYASEKLVCPAAYLIKTLSKEIKLIYFEPIYLGEHIENKPKFIKESRSRLAKISDLCLLPNEVRLKKFREDVGDHGNAIFVHNFPRHQDFEDIPLKEKPTIGKLKLFCIGFLGPDKLPIQLFEALEELKDKVELVIAGIDRYRDPEGRYSYSEIIKIEINQRALEENVQYVGLIKERSDLLQQCSKADVGLAFSGKTALIDVKSQFRTEGNVMVPEFSMAGTSQRPFEYMGLGLVLLVSDLPEWEDFFVKDGYAYSCDTESSESIKETLEYLYDNRDSLFEKGRRNKKKILEEWNYNIEFKKVEKYIAN